jgi:ketosteroid isomerase-like protein
MKNSILLLSLVFLLLVMVSCNPKTENQSSGNFKEEIRKTEHEFKTLAKESSIAEAFYRFADSSAVINRGIDSLITGKENIKHYYERPVYQNATVDWEPDFIEVSVTGDLGYSYGKYLWQIKDSSGMVNEYRGIYMTIWKKQKDGTWKYVWD